MHRQNPTAILIAGPTASGKSALALELAARHGGVIVNADSMQVYRELSILTARPTAADEGAAPHRLYGHVPAAEAYSVARWLEDVGAVCATIWEEGRLPIIVGGTGLYFKALTEGLSPVPAIPAEVRDRWRRLAGEAPAGALHAWLTERDPVMAARLAPGDTQRLTRALEVVDATGQSLAEWQKLPGVPRIAVDAADCICVSKPREELHRRADARFDHMMAEGALEEVAALSAQDLPTTLPAMRALGVAPLLAYLAGTLSRREAVERGKLETRQYIKRQETWLNRNMYSWKRV